MNTLPTHRGYLPPPAMTINSFHGSSTRRNRTNQIVDPMGIYYKIQLESRLLEIASLNFMSDYFMGRASALPATPCPSVQRRQIVIISHPVNKTIGSGHYCTFSGLIRVCISVCLSVFLPTFFLGLCHLLICSCC